ncbi:MAG: hypothetical protein LBN98_06515 [Prevotellaceae bacterium]|nr:hypothetical protein [Prevotellaceae bacterium]
MKKVLSVAALALIFAACGTKDAGLSVDKFYENPAEYIGKEVTIAGVARVCCQSGAIQITGSEKNVITLIPAEGFTAPEKAVWKVKAKGIINEEIIDETYIATLTDQANATEDSTAKADLLAKAEKIKGIIVAEGVIRKYSIDATAIEIIECDKEDAACCKKDSTKACCKKDSTKACSEKDSTKINESAAE